MSQRKEKHLHRIVNLAIFMAIAAVFTSALFVSYELGRIDGKEEQETRMILASREAVERRNVDLPMLVTPVTYQAAEDVPEESVENPANEPDNYQENVPLSPELKAVLKEACEETGVEYAIALGLIEVESDFHEDTYNGCSGCYGLMQLNPAYFPEDLDSADNIRIGVAHLADCIARYNDLEAGLTAYNAGYDNGSRWYAEAVLEAAERWRGN